MKKIVVLFFVIISLLASTAFSAEKKDFSFNTAKAKPDSALSRMIKEYYSLVYEINEVKKEKKKVEEEKKKDDEKFKQRDEIERLQIKLKNNLLKKSFIIFENGSEELDEKNENILKQNAKMINDINELSDRSIIVIVESYIDQNIDLKKSLDQALTRAKMVTFELIDNCPDDTIQFEIRIFNDYEKENLIKIKTKTNFKGVAPTDPQVERIKDCDKRIENLSMQIYLKKGNIEWLYKNYNEYHK